MTTIFLCKLVGKIAIATFPFRQILYTASLFTRKSSTASAIILNTFLNCHISF